MGSIFILLSSRVAKAPFIARNVSNNERKTDNRASEYKVPSTYRATCGIKREAIYITFKIS